MKKPLHNFKFLFLALLFCANIGWSQTVFQETFGSTAVTAANNYSGGTSSPTVNYTTNIAGYSAVGLDTNNNGFLNFMPNTVTGANRVSVVGTLPTGSGLNGVLHSNTNLVTWTVNMKSSRLSTNTFSSSTGYPANKYFNAVVLCATNGNLISSSSSPGTGYAIVVQKSSNNSVSGKASVNLIKFSNGIGDVVNEASVVTRLIESPELAEIPSATTPNNLSIKVTYNSSIDLWELSYREDAGTIFVDAATGSLTLGGTATDVPTSSPMTNFGYVAGLQSSTNVANSFQFDNLQISLSPPPAYTAPPVVEKRQALNSSLNPTVANLVATGTNLKWYAALTGGAPLLSTAPLSYTNYYVSQTVNGTESTRVATQVFVGDTALKTLPFYEGFAGYNIADKLILMNNGANTLLTTNNGVGLGSWSITPSANITDDVTIVASPGWSANVLPIETGNAITYAGSGIDPELQFTNTTSGSLYSSFVFTAADASSIVASTTTDPNYSTPTGFYSFLSESINSGTGSVSTSYASSVMFRKNIATGKFNLGLSKSNSITECVWSPTEYDFNTQHVIVISYENIGDANSLNQVSNFWIDPVTTSQPAANLSQNNPTTDVTRDHLDRIKLVQASSASTPLITMDEIRVANNWGEALGGPSTYVALPVVESRQAFNSNSNPTVANLVATGSNLKWYTAATGGSALTSATALSYANYFVSQTINGNESPRVGTQVFVGDTALKTLPFYESFAGYNIADKLILMNNGANSLLTTNNGVGLGSWSITPSSNITDDVTIVASPVWSANILPTGTGNAITFAGSGVDPELFFTNTTSGNLFSSFIFTAADATSIVASTTTDPNYSTPTGLYSFLSETTDSGTGLVTTNYASDVMFRKNMVTGKFNLGLSKSNNGIECVWSPTEYDFNTQHVIVISYENIADADALNQVSNLWIDPITAIQPTPTLSQNSPVTSVSRDHLDRIKILQASSASTPLVILDEIRVANNWANAIGSSLSADTVYAVSEFKMYPNPVSNGKLYIASSTSLEKVIAIYNTLGQEVLQTKITTEAINVSSLSKGTYFVKITEEGNSVTKKLIVQ